MGELEENDNLLKSMKIWNVANKKWKWEPTYKFQSKSMFK